MKIAIIGAGNVGGSLAKAFAGKGHDVRIGVRDPDKVADLIAECGDRTEAADPQAAAAFGEVVFLTVPWSAALAVVESLGDLGDKILADCTNPVGWDNGPIHHKDVAGSSGAEKIAEKTGARVVKAFSTHGWEINLSPAIGDQAVDHYVCGDDDDARAAVSALARDIGFHPVDVGPLRNAASLEHLAILWIHMAMMTDKGREIGFKLLGA